MKIRSTDFAPGGEIPVRFTQEGDDLSPALVFEDVPAQARSLVLISDDPDAPDPEAPKWLWLHWLAVNLPPSCPGLPAGAGRLAPMPEGCLQAVNDCGERGWSGPKPPIGTHRYYFHLYALDAELDLPEDFTRAQAEAAMAGHIIDEAHVHGTYLALANRPKS